MFDSDVVDLMFVFDECWVVFVYIGFTMVGLTGGLLVFEFDSVLLRVRWLSGCNGLSCLGVGVCKSTIDSFVSFVGV